MIRHTQTMLRLLLAGLTALGAAGCGSKGAVSLLARVENPELSVDQAALGTAISGRFTLVLELGEYAESDTEVSLSSFSIAQGEEELVAGLALAPEGRSFPVKVSPGGSERVTLGFGGSETYDAALADALCGGAVRLQGGVTDTLSDAKATPVRSADFSASCE